MRARPREVGRRLHGLAVNAGNLCGGSPNLSSEIGCTWYSRLGVGCDGSDFTNAPICDGAMVIGPLRNNAYSRPIFALVHHELSMVLSVCAFFTLNAMRNCRWSCRLPPTPGSSCATAMPCPCNNAPGPMPESCKICGLPIAP